MPHQKTVALPILPGATLGVMGGGQLGRMFIHAAQSMGYTTAVLDPDANSPAGLVSHHHVQTDYLDADGLKELAQLCQAVTTEFEKRARASFADFVEIMSCCAQRCCSCSGTRPPCGKSPIG